MKEKLINEVRRRFYLDSVALMRMSRIIADIDGVADAAMMMGTPTNIQIMADAGLVDKDFDDADGGDLVIAIAAADTQTADSALEQARSLLDTPAQTAHISHTWRPHTVESALKAMPDANLALISLPGEYAAAEARKALRLGLHVMIFSDNVPIEDEVSLKQQGRELGLLVMGPDCGTTILNGRPLAFANEIPEGNTGIVGASGTGIQEVSCLIAQCGGGISQAIGVGGRDLSEAVGGITTLMAIEALDRDPGTEHIITISKPPSPAIASRIIDRVAASKKTFTVCFIGSDEPALPGNARFASTLKAAAETVFDGDQLNLPVRPSIPVRALPAERKHIRGLYSGGTLCAEAQVVLLTAGESVSSNVPVAGASHVTESNLNHVLLDLGDDQFTKGRPHPMIDPAVRDDVIIEALHDPAVGVILLDMILGYGAGDDPARELKELLLRHQTTDMPVILASVTGTEDDTQQRSVQIGILESANVGVAASNADAAALALAHVQFEL